MDTVQQQAEVVSYAPSPPEEFCGREEERERLAAVISRTGEHGQAVMISGPPGIGKSSLLSWLAREVRECPGGLPSPVLRAEVFDLPGMIFSAFRELVGDLRKQTAPGRIGGEGMREAIRYAGDVLEKYAAPVEPVGLLPKTGEEIIGVFARSPEVGYDRVRQAFGELLRELGREMTGAGRIAAILLDDVHLASNLDRRLLRDTVHDLPPGILLAFTCRTEGAACPGPATLQEIRDSGYPEVQLPGMRRDEIRELGERRFRLAVDDAAAALLETTCSDPFSLMACFNALRCRGLAPSAGNMADVLAGAGGPAALAFTTLSGPGKALAEELCVLNPPFPVPVVACMLKLKETDVMLAADRMQESGIFRRLPGTGYAFAHPLLQEHCRRELSNDARIALNARAADCFERTMHRLPGRLHVLLSLACHFFHAQEYGKAADLNLELGLRFYHREDYDTALVLTERAIASAEHLGDDALLAAARRQGDLIRQKVAGPVEPAQ
jgi:hypothetical protein